MYVHNMSYMYVMPSYIRMPFILVYDPIFVPLCTPYHFFCPSVCLCYFWPFTFIEKSDCGKINFVLYVISVVMILVKLLQVIWGYITCFVVCQSFCPSLYIFERYAFYMIMVLCHQCFILWEPGVLVVKGHRRHQNLRGNLRIFFPEGTSI